MGPSDDAARQLEVIDRAIHAQMAKMTAGLSPASFMLAALD